jgi:hypothetical protein
VLILGKNIDNLEENKNVYLIGVIINKREYEKYSDLIIDDFSNIVVLRTFDLDLKNFEIGDLIFAQGYIKEYLEKKRVYLKNIKKIDEINFFYWKIRQFLNENYYFDLEEIKNELKEKEENLEANIEKEIEKEIEKDIEEIPIEIEEIEVEEFDPKKYVLEIIESSPNKEISLDELYKKANKLSKEEIDKILEELSDEIFEPRPGIIKKIEI